MTSPKPPSSLEYPGTSGLASFAVTSGGVGSIWDISWHKSIGRDSFWTPAHILIYLCGVIAGLTCGYVILATTFGRNPAWRAASVKVWGFRGPLGAFLCAWGGIAMITSAPFDDWWHNAYGLDVRVLSPPHVVLMFGLIAIRFGTLLFILGQLSRARGTSRTILNGLLLYTFMCIMAISLGAFQETTIRTNMHSARFYLVVSLAIPLWMAAVSAVSSSRWACTTVAAIYTAYYLTFIWILPLFPAEPKLGPVYQRGHAICPARFSVAADCARARHRPAAAEVPRLVEVAAFRCGRMRVPGRIRRGAMALCRVTAIAGRAQLDFRNPQYSFLCAIGYGLCALPVYSVRAKRFGVLAYDGPRAGRSHRDDADRARLGRRNAQAAAVNKYTRGSIQDVTPHFTFSSHRGSPAAHAAVGVRVLLGLSDKAATKWDGGVSARGARIVSLEPWRFEGGDDITGNQWRISTHPIRLFRRQPRGNCPVSSPTG